MTLLPAETPALLGDQAPRVSWVPPYTSSSGQEAVELAALAGLDLDPWQQFALAHSLGERDDGRWAAREVGVLVARQNGKGGIIEGRELAGLYLLGERLIIHSAHLFDTALEAFRRLLTLIEDTPELDKRVQRVSRAHGEEGIELKGRQRIRFRTRTNSGGRGLTGDCVILDEAMVLSEAVHGALMPTVSARPNPQIWYVGTAVDQAIHEHGVVFARVRERGQRGDEPALAWFEWSVDPAAYAASPHLAGDVRAWAQANPALGIRISLDAIASEQRAMTPRVFATERLSVGDWPRTDGKRDEVIDAEAWAACADPASTFDGSPTFAVDVTPERSFGSIGVAGVRPDGLAHIEIVEHHPGTGWIPTRCAALKAKHLGARFVIDPRGPASSLIPDLVDAGIDATEVSSQEYGRACAALYDAVVATDAAGQRTPRLRYPSPQPELDEAVAGVRTRPLGDAWAWGRRSAVDISPLVAITLALWVAQTHTQPSAPGVWDLNEIVERLRAEVDGLPVPEEPPAQPKRTVPTVTFHRF